MVSVRFEEKLLTDEGMDKLNISLAAIERAAVGFGRIALTSQADDRAFLQARSDFAKLVVESLGIASVS